jgi:soluble lytic murein transglycosylase-like protein
MPWVLLGALALLALGGGAAVAGGQMLTEGRLKYIYWDRYDDLFKAAGARYGIDWRFLKASAVVESSLGQNPRVMAGGASEDGKSYGLMQFTLPTAVDLRPRTTVSDLNQPEISIDLAGKYISQLIRRFPGDLHKAIISYNQGPGNTAKGNDFTGNYWEKWSTAFKLVEEG